jgi:hypothetical protein
MASRSHPWGCNDPTGKGESSRGNTKNKVSTEDLEELYSIGVRVKAYVSGHQLFGHWRRPSLMLIDQKPIWKVGRENPCWVVTDRCVENYLCSGKGGTGLMSGRGANKQRRSLPHSLDEQFYSSM